MYLVRRAIVPNARPTLIIAHPTNSINAERSNAIYELWAAIEDVITPQLEVVCPKQQRHDSHFSPCEYLLKSGHYLKELSSLDLWPISKIIHQTDLAAVSSQLLRFKNHLLDEWGPTNANGELFKGRTWVSASTYCQSPKKDLKSMLQKAADATSTKQRGLCLKCVKEGKVTRDDGNCRAETEAAHEESHF